VDGCDNSLLGSSVRVGLTSGVWFAGVFGDVLWMGMDHFARGDSRGVVMTLF